MAGKGIAPKDNEDKESFFSRRTKNFFLFAFFLLMSSAFWIVQKLEEPIAVKVDVPVKLTNVPKDVIITTDLPKKMQITVRDKGSELISLFWSPQLDTLSIDFRDYDTHEITDNTLLVPSLVEQMLKEKLPIRSTITEMTPDTLVYAYNRGMHKRLPIRLRGAIRTHNQYNLDNYIFTPESVEVYAPAKVLDTLRAAYTEVTILEDLTESTTLPVPLIHSRSLRFFPDTVTLQANIDILTRKSIEIYVQGIDFPEGKELRTLPATVTLTYLVSASQAKLVDPNRFQVTVSYNDIKDSQTNKCKPQIISMPGSISNAFITPQQVDFLIEDINTSKVTPEHPVNINDDL